MHGTNDSARLGIPLGCGYDSQQEALFKTLLVHVMRWSCQNRNDLYGINGNNLFSADQMAGIELGSGDDEEFGDEIL